MADIRTHTESPVKLRKMELSDIDYQGRGISKLLLLAEIDKLNRSDLQIFRKSQHLMKKYLVQTELN